MEILKDYFPSKDYRSIFIKFFMVVFTVIIAIYIGNMLFGKKSFNVYLNLIDERDFLLRDIYNLQRENEILQKEYFELKDLEPKGLKNEN